MNANAQVLAEHFAKHEKIAAVLYPGLAGHADHALAKSQMSGGYGSLMSLMIKGSKQTALKVVSGLDLFQRATSLGGVESLVAHPATMTHAAMTGEDQQAAGIADNLLRLSIGIEHPDDLIADMDGALGRI